jgi:hypothetical protein
MLGRLLWAVGCLRLADLEFEGGVVLEKRVSRGLWAVDVVIGGEGCEDDSKEDMKRDERLVNEL